MKNKKITITIASAMLMTTALNSAVFNNYANAQDIKINSDNADGKLMLKADIGYVYSFGGDWNKSNAESPSIGGNKSTATGGVGYGVSLGYTHKSGLGLSADYLGFNHKWTGLGTDVNLKTEFNYDASYHVVTLVPSYRIKLDAANNWGLRVGLGVGFSLSDVSWAQKISNGAQSGGAKIAGGATYAAKTGVATLSLSDFGRSTALGGTCAVLDSNIFFSDSQGTAEVQAVLGSGSAGATKCNQTGTPAAQAVEGFTDTEIATALNNGKIALFDSDATHPVSYNVWKDVLGLNATIDGVNYLLGSINNFGTGSAVTMGLKTWAGLSYDQQTRLKSTMRLVTNDINAVNPATITACTNGGGTWTGSSCTPASSGGKAKDDAGFVLAPQVALEYDNGMLHADVNVKYIHELFNVRYFGSEGSVSGQKESGAITYTSIAGPLALFVGAGLGINF